MGNQLVPDETVINTLARWVHVQKHKGGKAYFCESDRKFAQDLLLQVVEWGWAIVEDDRSS